MEVFLRRLDANKSAVKNEATIFQDMVKFYESQGEHAIEKGNPEARRLSTFLLSSYNTEFCYALFSQDQIFLPAIGAVIQAGMDDNVLQQIQSQLLLRVRDDAAEMPKALTLLQELLEPDDYAILLKNCLADPESYQARTANEYFVTSLVFPVYRCRTLAPNAPLRDVLEKRFAILAEVTIPLLGKYAIEASLQYLVGHCPDPHSALITSICSAATDVQWKNVIMPWLKRCRLNYGDPLGNIPQSAQNRRRIEELISHCLQKNDWNFNLLSVPLENLAKLTSRLHSRSTDNIGSIWAGILWRQVCRVGITEGRSRLEDIFNIKGIRWWQIKCWAENLTPEGIVHILIHGANGPSYDRNTFFVASLQNPQVDLNLLFKNAFQPDASTGLFDERVANRVMNMLCVLLEKQSKGFFDANPQIVDHVFEMTMRGLILKDFKKLVSSNPYKDIPPLRHEYVLRDAANKNLLEVCVRQNNTAIWKVCINEIRRLY